MKILIVAWRAWSAAHRYKSLAVNAKALGHEVLGLASDRNKEAPLTCEAFAEIGVPCLEGDQVDIVAELNRFQPDAIFGEYWFAGVVKEEVESHRWAAQHGKPAFILDHRQCWDFFTLFPPSADFVRSVLLTANETCAESARRAGWKSVHVIGLPDFDLIQDSYDIPAIKRRWGIPVEQPLIALFLKHVSSPAGTGELSLPHEQLVMFSVAEFIRAQGWKAVAHGHAEERRGKTVIHFPQRVPFLQGLENKGVTFIASWAPGRANDVTFLRGSPAELIAASDACVGSAFGPVPKCLAMGHKYFWVYTPSIMSTSTPMRRALHECLKGTTSFDSVGKDLKTLLGAVQNKKNRCHCSEEAIERWFYKLDGKCWKRMLDLAEELQ